MGQESPIHGPLDRKMDLEEGTINPKNLAARVEDAISKKLGYAPLRYHSADDWAWSMEFEGAARDPSFKAKVTLYRPDPNTPELKGIETAGVYVYSDNLNTRNDLCTDIWNALFTS